MNATPHDPLGLQSIMPRKVTVDLGDVQIEVHEPKITQADAMMRALADVNIQSLGALIGPIVEAMKKSAKKAATANAEAKVAAAIGVDIGDDTGRRLLDLLAEFGSEVIKQAWPIVTREMFPAVKECAVGALDCRGTFDALKAAGLIDEGAEATVDEDECYVSCRAVRAALKERFTARTAVEVIGAAFRLLDPVAVMGNLFEAMAPAAPLQETQAGQPG